MATKTKNDRTAPVKEWAPGSGNEKKLRDMMGLSDDVAVASDESSERTVPDETSTHTPPEDAAQTEEVTIAATITTDASGVVASPNEHDGAASSAPDRDGGIPIRTIDDEATERSEDTVLTESDMQTLPNGDDKVSAHTSHTSPSRSVADNRIIAETQPTADSDSSKRTVKHRKSNLNEYCATFLTVPRIKDRKPVFVSGEVRDKIDRIVRLLGERAG